MPKLTDINILELFDNDRIQFKTPVSVSKDGEFTTTLPKEAVDKLKEYGLPMEQNRLGNSGYFHDKTLEGLNHKIHAFVKECISRQVIEDKLVIKYRIKTKAAYIIDTDGEILPNGKWVKNHQDFEDTKVTWHEGNENFAGNNFTPTLSVYAKVYHKKKYAFKSGKTFTTYEEYRPKGIRTGSIDWLASQVNIVPDDRNGWGSYNKQKDLELLPEIDATEKVAALFVKIIMLIDKANELFKELNEPSNILAALAANNPKQLEF